MESKHQLVCIHPSAIQQSSMKDLFSCLEIGAIILGSEVMSWSHGGDLTREGCLERASRVIQKGGC